MSLPLPIEVARQVAQLAKDMDTIIVVPSNTERLRRRLADHGIESVVVAHAVVLVPDEGGDKVAVVVDLCLGEADYVLHWRRDIPGLDRLRIPDALVLRRVMVNRFPFEELVLAPETIDEIKRSIPEGAPPPGAPRWLAGMLWQARHRGDLLADAIARLSKPGH